MENTKFYVTAEELSEAYGICLSKAYKLIRQLNAELETKGFIVIQGKVPRRYVEERVYGYSYKMMSFIVSPVTSFAITCGVYVLSAYYTIWFLPGSYTMWVRSSYFDVRGLNPLSGLLIAAFMVVAVVVLGKSYFERKDVI